MFPARTPAGEGYEAALEKRERGVMCVWLARASVNTTHLSNLDAGDGCLVPFGKEQWPSPWARPHRAWPPWTCGIRSWSWCVRAQGKQRA